MFALQEYKYIILQQQLKKYYTNRLPELKKDLDVIVLDLETLRTFEEVHSLLLLGVSVLVVYRYRNNKYYVFTEEELKNYTKKQEVIWLLEDSQAIVGHNILKFDFEVLGAVLGKNLSYLKPKTVDFFRDIFAKHSLWKEFFPDNEYAIKKYCRIGLQTIARECFGKEFTKTLVSGKEAVRLWRMGTEESRQKVIDYCINDVFLTRAIFEYSLLNGGRIKFLNLPQLYKLQNNELPTRKLHATCILKYPRLIQQIVQEPPKEKKPKQLKLF